MSSKKKDERRNNQRIYIEIWIEEGTETGVVYRRAGNLSVGGVLLDHGFPTPVGQQVALRFTLPGDSETIRVKAEVISAEAEGRRLVNRLRFIDLTDAHCQRINNFIRNAPGPLVYPEMEPTEPGEPYKP